MPTPKINKNMVLKMKEQMGNTLDSQGEEYSSGGSDYFLKLPEGAERWLPETGEDLKDPKGKHFFDIVPFVVGKKYPKGTKGGKKGRNIDVNCKEGDLYHKLDIWYHKNVGVDKLMVPCNFRNHDKPCPECEEVSELYNSLENDQEKRELWASRGAKRQTVYNVKVVDEDGNPLSDKTMVFNQPYVYMDKILKEKSVPAKGGKIYFAHPTEGRTIYFRKTVDPDYGYDISGHEFYERDYEISMEDMENAVCLDECIKEYTYDEIKRLMAGETLQEIREGGSSEYSEPEVDGSDVDIEEDDVPMNYEEVQEEESEQESEPEPEKKAAPKKEVKVDKFSAFKEDGEWSKCPAGDEEVFGKNFDMFEDCDSLQSNNGDPCPAREACEKAKNASKKKTSPSTKK